MIYVTAAGKVISGYRIEIACSFSGYYPSTQTSTNFDIHYECSFDQRFHRKRGSDS